MKPITFTTDEKKLLQDLLKKRLDSYRKTFEQDQLDKSSKRHFENLYFKPLVSALDKVSNQDTVFYDSREKKSVISCINEHYDDFYNELQLPTALSWLTITEQKRLVVAKLDNSENILVKCGFYNKRSNFLRDDTDFRYGNILKAVDKLKMSNMVFLSKIGEKTYYKIAFIYENIEYATFELTHKISWRDIKFASLNNESPQEFGAQRFSLMTTKEDAKFIFANCDKEIYPESVLDFINSLLN